MSEYIDDSPPTAPDSVGIVKTEVAAIRLPEGGLKLEKGGVLPHLEVAFERYGALAADGGNVILLCHALSGDAHAAGFHAAGDRKPGWWDNMIGPGKGIDTNRFQVICSNVLGGCQGTTGPASINPATGRHYGAGFPEITIGDMVTVQKLLLEHLGIGRLHGVIGGSAGGLQVLEWTVRFPEFVARAACIASAESLSAQALSFDIIARKVIMADPSWKGGNYYGWEAPDKGLSLARMIGHITYLSKESMDLKFGRERREGMETDAFNTDFQVESYLNHQGQRFVERFDANSFLHITAAMNAFALAEQGASLEQVFSRTRSQFLILSVSSDWLYPAEQSRRLAQSLLRAGKSVAYAELTAPYGHDSFLIPSPDLSAMISAFFEGERNLRASISDLGSEEKPEKSASVEEDIINAFMSRSGPVLDLGCGDSTFLARVAHERQMDGLGIDIEFNNIAASLRRGMSAFQMNLDEGLGMISDNAYEYATLNRTLLEVHKPHLVLKEMVRVARYGIVTFPNFGSWRHRLRLGLKGRLPMAGGLPYAWFDTPNIHFLTLKDFKAFCKAHGIGIVDILCIPDGFIGRVFKIFRMCNVGADRVVVKIAARGTVPDSEKSKDPCACTD